MNNYEFEKKKLINMINKDIFSMLKEYGAVIAGGTITSLFTRNEVNDFDIYFRNKKDMASFVKEVVSDGGWIVAHTSKAVLFSIDNQEYQAITFKEFESVEDLFNTFDFTVCMGAFDFKTEEFYFHEHFMKHNSQRILKFNQATAFPIISALRVDKYKKKGYYISKVEFIRIVLECMNLNVSSVEELKEHMGGLYGYNLDKIIDDSEEFSLDNIIEKLSLIELDDSYFKMPKLEAEDVFDLDKIIIEILGTDNVEFILHNDEYYFIHNDGEISLYGDKPTSYKKIIKSSEHVKDLKVYKFVEQRKDGTLFSFYDKKFEYKVGETAIARGKGLGVQEPILYVGQLKNCNKFIYRTNKNSVLIELSLETVNDIENISEINDTYFGVKKAKVERIVPKEEYLDIIL